MFVQYAGSTVYEILATSSTYSLYSVCRGFIEVILTFSPPTVTVADAESPVEDSVTVMCAVPSFNAVTGQLCHG